MGDFTQKLLEIIKEIVDFVALPWFLFSFA